MAVSSETSLIKKLNEMLPETINVIVVSEVRSLHQDLGMSNSKSGNPGSSKSCSSLQESPIEWINCTESRKDYTYDKLFPGIHTPIFLIYSAMSFGDQKITLIPAGRWTTDSGLKLRSTLQSPPLINFQGRNLVLVTVHVS